VSFNHARMTDVSRPPEYANTIFCLDMCRKSTLLHPLFPYILLPSLLSIVPLTHERRKNRLLRMQSVFRLIEYEGVRTVDHFRRYFFAAMRRQAVQEDVIMLRV